MSVMPRYVQRSHVLLCLSLSNVYTSRVLLKCNQATFNCKGDCTSLGSHCYQLTPEQINKEGAVWFQDSVSPDNSIEVTANINLGDRNANGASGMAFVIQKVGNNINPIGSPEHPDCAGGGLNYKCLSDYVAIEFDTFPDALGDAFTDRIRIMTRTNGGTPVQHAEIPSSTPCFRCVELEDGQTRYVRIKYDEVIDELYIYMVDEINPVPMAALPIDLNAILGVGPSDDIYYGFTAATGPWLLVPFKNEHKVCFLDGKYILKLLHSLIIPEE